jgi:hypothetical protein
VSWIDDVAATGTGAANGAAVVLGIAASFGAASEQPTSTTTAVVIAAIANPRIAERLPTSARLWSESKHFPAARHIGTFVR